MPFINDKLASMAVDQKRKEMEANQRVLDIEPESTDTPIRKNQTRFKFNVEEIMKRMRKKIFGQEKALQSIENMLKVVRADISDPEKPLYIALFLGPTGVGKTEIVRVLAEAIHGNRDSFCRVDMNTLSLNHYAAALTGAPPGYVGSKEGSTILDKERIEGSFSRPGIVLFDEIEKASLQVIQTLLNVLDNGVITIASGEETINFRNTLIFMTSNIGAREIQRLTKNEILYFVKLLFYRMNPSQWLSHDNEGLLDEIIHKKLEESFRPEFINRIDDIITFNWLEQHTLFDIIDMLTEQMNRRLQKFNCQLQLNHSAKEFLVDRGFDKRYGARALKRAVRQYVEVPLAELLMETRTQEGTITYIGQRSSNGIDIKNKKSEVSLP